MARTHGRSRLPLPQSLVQALDVMGFVPFEPPGTDKTKGPHSFTLQRRPKFVFQAVASTIPGDSAVTAIWPGQPAARMEVDALLFQLEHEVAGVTSPTQAADAILAQLAAARG